MPRVPGSSCCSLSSRSRGKFNIVEHRGASIRSFAFLIFRLSEIFSSKRAFGILVEVGDGGSLIRVANHRSLQRLTAGGWKK